MTNETVLRFSDKDYTIKIQVEDVQGMKRVSFHRKLEGNDVIDSKFTMFLDDSQYKQMANFLWFLSGEKK